jgi:sulfatase maturation enzyme AslB (radical SAM superfamily)
MSCKSKSYCPYPFIGASLQSDGVTLPCGQYMNVAPFTAYQPIEEARNIGHMQDMRMRMLNNEHDSGCQCPAEEAAGMKSMRQHAIDQFGFQPFGKLKTVEIFFDNVCNLKCRMCGSPRSHLWFDEEKQLYGTTMSSTKYVKNTLHETLDVEELEEIKVYGGEPLQTREADTFFKRVIDQGNIEKLYVEMSTNGTTLPMPHVLEAFKRCKRLKLDLSIDAFGKLNDYIRSGSVWEEIVENMKFFDSLIDERQGETIIIVHSAVGVYNINMMEDLNKFVEDNFPRFLKTKQMIQYPVFLNIQNLPEEYKETLEPFIDQETKNYMHGSNNDYFPHFVNFHKGLDKIRNEDLNDLNPLLSSYIEKYNTIVDSSKFFVQQIKILQGQSE